MIKIARIHAYIPLIIGILIEKESKLSFNQSNKLTFYYNNSNVKFTRHCPLLRDRVHLFVLVRQSEFWPKILVSFKVRRERQFVDV